MMIHGKENLMMISYVPNRTKNNTSDANNQSPKRMHGTAINIATIDEMTLTFKESLVSLLILLKVIVSLFLFISKTSYTSLILV